jgi:hypothetical protein
MIACRRLLTGGKGPFYLGSMKLYQKMCKMINQKQKYYLVDSFPRSHGQKATHARLSWFYHKIKN